MRGRRMRRGRGERARREDVVVGLGWWGVCGGGF